MRRKRELMKSNLSTRFYYEMHYKIESKGNDRDEKNILTKVRAEGFIRMKHMN